MTGLVGNPLPYVTTQNGFPVQVPPNIIRVVAQAIKYVWAEINANPAKHLVSISPGAPEEDVYTDAICNLLLQMLEMEIPIVPGFSGDTFETVCRGENVPNYNGKLLNKQPDLIIRLSNNPLSITRRLVGIYIESKVVCMAKPMYLYTTEGMSRFVGGDYGWTMQAGIMLAYQKPKFREISSLETQLAKEKELQSNESNGKYLKTSNIFTPITAVSTHKRQWKYLNGGDPGEISIWHMWDLIVPKMP
ncbi:MULTISPECIES: hypothetical protein [Photorhabdus]|uniref:hypothetical protein n=1 Tax=Photorhabdus TaxID=29487 RepID=UPI000DCB6E1C|nr:MULTISPECIES: hypothetical protein [Photorhabdus]MCT8342276.1 hypothetical protein [Photorhabdus kleinii]RAW98484.1 hypothetical protein CKY05_11800 [Photorhabdus sp. S10-54]RAW98598.1 hypothetical protein CKY03_11325 [Photorhabdus sp. S9-53]RAX02799.1 hypothetical protein CKY04_11885 [Photorhabdus sp. S8-52]